MSAFDTALDFDFLADNGDDDVTEILSVACESYGSPGATLEYGDAL